jgi:hypothetical protein
VYEKAINPNGSHISKRNVSQKYIHDTGVMARLADKSTGNDKHLKRFYNYKDIGKPGIVKFGDLSEQHNRMLNNHINPFLGDQIMDSKNKIPI